MKRRLPVLLAIAAASTAMADTSDEVRCREIGFSKAAEAQDHAAFVAYIDSDARFVSESVLRGPAAIGEAWSVFFQADGPRIRWRPQYVEVLRDGTLALSRGPYRVVTRNEAGDEVEAWGTFNSVWRLQADGSWKIVFDAGSPSSSPPPEAIRALLLADDDCESGS